MFGMGLFSFLKPKRKGVAKAARGSLGGTIGGDEIQGFLDDEELLIVTSSNVAAAQYHNDSGELMIEYLNGDAWLYTVSRAMAEDFARAPSKGIFVWDRIKIRGTVHEHQVPAKKIK